MLLLETCEHCFKAVSYLHLYSVNGKTLAVDCIDSYIKFVAIEGDRMVSDSFVKFNI